MSSIVISFLSLSSSKTIFIPLSFLKHSFTGYGILGWLFFFLHHFKIVVHSSCFCGFWWGMHNHLILVLLICNVVFFCGCFEFVFSLSLIFSSLIMICMGLIFFGLSYLEFVKLHDYVEVYLSPNSGCFQPLYLQIFFVP